MRNQAKKCKDNDTLHQIIREAKYLSSQRRSELAMAIYRIPKSKRNIGLDEIETWFELHSHQDNYHGCIGGHISKTEIYTSLGTLVTYYCGSCGEEAYVDDPNFG